MKRMNCWEYQKCGREPGGSKVKELGACQAAVFKAGNGLHGGENGGRICWYVTGTLCGGKGQGSFAEKLPQCLECSFYNQVQREEGAGFLFAKKIAELLKHH